jgi:hypothetical protein
MNHNNPFLLGLFLVLTLAMFGCQPASPTLTNDMEILVTQSAQTMQALREQMAIPTPGPMDATLTPTLALPDPTVTPMNTAKPPATVVTYCDWVSFVKDVTIPDGIFIKQNSTFTKTWRLKNRGNCTWTTAYSLVFTEGSHMNGPVNMALPHEVRPGDTIDISVTLTAPGQAGSHRGYWMLKNPSGVLFGYGDRADKAFFVDIKSGPINSVGFVSGRVCFPSEHIPPMTVFFQRLSDDHVTLASIRENQTSYHLQLDPGTYQAYAWLEGFTMGGAYTYHDQYDHGLKPFTVNSGSDITNIDICDWYGGPGSVPLPPYMNTGTISGALSYPGEFIPTLRVVAFNLTTGRYYWVDTQRDQQTYQISNLPAGIYNVVAYFRAANSAAGYSIARHCDLNAECDHALIPIEIKPNTKITNINPVDWYAPIGTFPPDPTY